MRSFRDFRTWSNFFWTLWVVSVGGGGKKEQKIKRRYVQGALRQSCSVHYYSVFFKGGGFVIIRVSLRTDPIASIFVVAVMVSA
jgi:hypothetical protein